MIPPNTQTPHRCTQLCYKVIKIYCTIIIKHLKKKNFSFTLSLKIQTHSGIFMRPWYFITYCHFILSLHVVEFGLYYLTLLWPRQLIDSLCSTEDSTCIFNVLIKITCTVCVMSADCEIHVLYVHVHEVLFNTCVYKYFEIRIKRISP